MCVNMTLMFFPDNHRELDMKLVSDQKELEHRE